MIDREFIARALIEEANKYVGHTENIGQNNRSSFIDSVNRFMGVPIGSPYCQSSLYFIANEVCRRYSLKNPLPKTAGARDAWNKSVNYRRKIANAEAGDFVYWVSKTDRLKGHAGLYLTHGTNKDFLTIEFNTDSDGGRDGNGVWNRTRLESGSSKLDVLGAVDVAQWIIDATTQRDLWIP